jgi:hypothetical protein
MKKTPPKKSARAGKKVTLTRPKKAVRRGANPARSKKKLATSRDGRTTARKPGGTLPSKKKMASKKKVASKKKTLPKTKVTSKRASVSKTPATTSARATLRRVRLVGTRPGRPDDADAFLRVRGDDPSNTKDDFAEELAEDFVGTATSGEEQGLETRDSVLDEEIGGPFVTTPAKREFAEGIDASNPEDAEREPFPSATRQSQP